MRHYTDWLETYLSVAIEGSEAPIMAHFWTGVSTIAGAIRRRVWIDQGRFEWTPNFFIVLTSPPGVIHKSTTINIGYEMLKEVPDVRIAPNSITPASLLQEMVDSAFEDPDIGLTAPLTASVSEIGTFLKPDDPELIVTLIDLWDGSKRPFKKRTVGRGFEEIPSPWFNLIGCTTPGWIAENIAPSALSGGLISRIIFPYGDKKRKRVALPDEHFRPDRGEVEDKLIEDLIHISKLHGPMEITTEAREWTRLWYERHEDRMDSLSAKLDERTLYSLSRKPTMLFKLAIIASLSRSDDLKITPVDLLRSLNALEEAEETSHKAFALVGKPLIPKMVELLVEFVHQSGEAATFEAAYRFFVDLIDFETFELVVTSAIRAGRVSSENRAGKPMLVCMPEKVVKKRAERGL